MIILFGGASETAEISGRIAGLGREVLVSMATDVELDIGSHEGVRLRRGKMSLEEMVDLIRQSGAQAVVDATHPYAAIVRENARRAANEAGVPYLTYIRPGADGVDDGEVVRAADHERAAEIAFSYGKPVLLTTGSRNLAPYARKARETATPLAARVLDHPDSLEACAKAGIPEECVIAGRGPFSVSQNLEHMDRYGAGVLVTKDSGAAGGVAGKIEAARARGARVVMVDRPEAAGENAYSDIDELIERIAKKVNGRQE